jgi:predicted transcriptional regulator of viral defense system
LVLRSEFDELAKLADDGLITAKQARDAGFTDSVLARLMQRGRLERMARGVYRIPQLGSDRFSQYREGVLWAQSSQGPSIVALSMESALAAYGLSDVNPAAVHLTVPKATRLRRKRPEWVVIHAADLAANEVQVHEGLPVTTIERTIRDLTDIGTRIDLLLQAIAGARREGFIGMAESRRLRYRLAKLRGTIEGSD